MSLTAVETMDAFTAGEVSKLLSIAERIRLCEECITGVVRAAEHWTVSAVQAKGLPADSPALAEDILSGPTIVARQLQLMIQTLKAIANGGTPNLPGRTRNRTSGRVAVPVFPTSGYFDSLTFMGLRGEVRMQPGVEAAQIHGALPERIRQGTIAGISVVLGAGNVSSIPATDSLNRIIFEGRRVVLKMNPVNDYLTPAFESAFAPLIRAHLLTIVKGDAELGAGLIQDPRVDDVHITGSAETHDRIVWGATQKEIQRRRSENDPVLNKPVTSELGNVTPWIFVPGRYSHRQLRSQAQHLAASITNNASFNCLATKVILTWKQWDQRNEFLSLVERFMKETPARPAYYPGAAERFQKFANSPQSPDDQNRLPWTLLTDQKIDERPELFEEESFVCVCAETQLDGKSPGAFLATATDFANERMTGTLCASITLPADFRRRHPVEVEHAVSELKYGSVCINQWSGLAYGLISAPWGAHPGATLQNVASGIGNVHNTYLLDRVEKTVLEGPLINFPKPVWFPAHSNAVHVANHLLNLYHRPSMFRLPPLFAAALMG